MTIKQICLLASLVYFFPLNAQDQNPGDIRVHDPVVIQQDDTYYLFCTGRGISVWASRNLKEWERKASVFKEAPTWTEQVVPGFKNHIWAPDISYHDGLYYLYYSISAFGKNTSAIGVATNKSLHQEDPDYAWTDHGIVIQSVPNRDLWNAIDPNLAVDENGVAWLSFGSFWGGLKLFRLGEDRLTPAEPQEWYTIAKRERAAFTKDDNAGRAALEAPFIFKKNDFYYLFASYDYCCRGAESTYKVRVGRSKDIRGPYLDRSGTDMNQGGGTLVIEGNKQWPGLGHNSIYTFEDQDYFIFHAYDMRDNGRPKLKVSPVSWDQEGWPIIDRENLK